MQGEADWSRRRFLSSRGLGASAGGVLGLLAPERGRRPPRPQADGLRTEVCCARRAMACEFNVFLPPETPGVVSAGEAALDEIQAMEELLTVHSDSSLMSRVNCSAADGPVPADGRLFALLSRAADLHRATAGAFDVATGALLRAWGLFGGPRRVPTEAELNEALEHSGMHHVDLDASRRTVHYRVRGLEIHLGAIGKGYAIDRAMARIRGEFGVGSVLIQGGSSSLRAVGSASPGEDGWLVGIQNPFDPARRVATVCLRDRAMGTSASNRQYFEAAGRRFGHILDPRTGRPADGLASVTVLAGDAATADALSTALFVMGLDKTRDFCHNHPEIAALLVLQPGRSSGTPASPQVVRFHLSQQECAWGDS